MARAVRTVLAVFLTISIYAVNVNMALANPKPQDIVEQLTVKLNAGVPIPGRLEKRIAASVKSVSSQLVVNQPVAVVNDRKELLEHTIKEVFDRVLIGYEVKQVTLVPGRETIVAVALTPVGDTIEDVKLEISVPGVAGSMREFIYNDLCELPDKILYLFKGMPIEAFDWAEGASRHAVKETIDALLPEFQAYIEIMPGKVTRIKATLYPMGQIVRETQVSMRSQSIPNVLLLEARPEVERQVEQLVGMPTFYVLRHQEAIQHDIEKALVENNAFKRYGLTVRSALVAAETSDLVIDAETPNYRFGIEGRFNLGTHNYETEVRAHAGKMIGKRYELFGEIEFIPKSITWRNAIGASVQVVPTTKIIYKYELKDGSGILGLNQKISPSLDIRVEKNLKTHNYQAGLAYRMNSLLTVELLRDRTESWLRLTGQL